MLPSVVLATGLLAALTLLPSAVMADESPVAGPQCALENLNVVAANAEDAKEACVGAGRALAFLAGHGIHLRTPVVLEIVAKLPATAPATAAGIFETADKRIYMLSFKAFRKFRTWFKIAIDREIYRSLAAHEVAHAIADANFQVAKPSIQAREYVAYVTLFATMNAPLRTRILQVIPGKGFEDEYRVSPVVFMFDPMYFGVQAYRHYKGLAQPTAFLREVLAGRVLVD